MADKIKEFFDVNDTPEVSDSTLWATFKVVIRGHVIAYEANLRKSHKRLQDVNMEVSKLEVSYRNTNDDRILHNILNLKYEYNPMLSRQGNDQILRLRQYYFELGDKPHVTCSSS